jgi:hypothetical protein
MISIDSQIFNSNDILLLSTNLRFASLSSAYLKNSEEGFQHFRCV